MNWQAKDNVRPSHLSGASSHCQHIVHAMALLAAQ
jgi:hypothetical protein